MAESAKKTREKRNLVRWNDELDKLLLLNVQFACNDAGMRIPWNAVAELMGDNFSKGAIEQHLSKVSKRRPLRLTFSNTWIASP